MKGLAMVTGKPYNAWNIRAYPLQAHLLAA